MWPRGEPIPYQAETLESQSPREQQGLPGPLREWRGLVHTPLTAPGPPTSQVS